MMRDPDVRATLREALAERHGSDPTWRLIEEFGIGGGEVRVDLVAIAHELHGYEIKSDADTLGRLSTQARLYSTVMDRMVLVVGDRHLTRARRMIPDWWGIWNAVPVVPGRVRLYPVRDALPNPEIDPFALASLMWRQEAHAILEDAGAADGLWQRPRGFLANRLVRLYPLDELRALVREALKVRTEWRYEA